MLRYFAFSVRDFRRHPDHSDFRLNWEIWITFSGRVRPVFHDDSKRKAGDNNFWVMPPRLRFHWEAASPKVERCVLNFPRVPILLEEVTWRRGFFCRTLDAAELAEARVIARSMAAASARRDTLSPLVFERGLLDLALLALRHEPTKLLSTVETLVAERVEHAVAWYREHVRNDPKLEEVAAELHISSSHLRRLFRFHLRKSPKAIFDGIRLEVAAALMISTAAPLKGVAEQSGFHSVTDFSRAFRRQFGVPPNVWRHTTNQALPAAARSSPRKGKGS